MMNEPSRQPSSAGEERPPNSTKTLVVGAIAFAATIIILFLVYRFVL
jgi:hypothetical protein